MTLEFQTLFDYLSLLRCVATELQARAPPSIQHATITQPAVSGLRSGLLSRSCCFGFLPPLVRPPGLFAVARGSLLRKGGDFGAQDPVCRS